MTATTGTQAEDLPVFLLGGLAVFVRRDLQFAAPRWVC
jgi:hypothetical protein